jgi:O-antigen ligase
MSVSVGLEGVRSDKRLLIVPALFFLSPFVTSAVPRLTWLFIALIAIALSVRALRQGIAWRELVPLDAVSVAAVLVAVYVSLNAIWAADRSGGFEKAALLWGLVLLTIAAFTAVAALDERRLRLAALGLAAGAALGAVYLLIEMLTDAAITRAVMNTIRVFKPDKAKHVSLSHGYVKKISLSELNQNATIVILSLWPALSVWALVANFPRRVILMSAFFLVTALAILLSEHQSSQIALVLSLAVFPFAWRWPKAAIRALAAVWCLGFALVLPLDFAAYRADLHMARWLPDSARARIILWEYTAERTLEHPWLGIGVDSTHALKKSGALEKPKGFVFPRSSGEHAHNLFLQTWYELGLVGAILLAIAGGVLALRMLRLPREIQPFAAASFAAFLGIAGFAWSMWQTWFMCAIALLILYLRVAASAPHEAASRPARRDEANGE